MKIALSCLKDILNNEENYFIKNSLYWACIKNKDTEIFDYYISLLCTNQEYAFYNRGYHLYYYGDMIFENFPFIDNDVNVTWEKTRKFMMDNRITVKTNDSYYIKLLDIWTYIDLAIFHNTILEDDEIISLKDNYGNFKIYLSETTKNHFDNIFTQLMEITIKESKK